MGKPRIKKSFYGAHWYCMVHDMKSNDVPGRGATPREAYVAWRFRNGLPPLI